MHVVFNSPQLTPEAIQFVDYEQVDWNRVRSSRYLMYQSFRYEYPGPVCELRQRLMVVPSWQHGDQVLQDYRLNVSAPTAALQYEQDSFGNRVVRYSVPRIDHSIDFEVWTKVERGAHQGLLPRVTTKEMARYLKPTKLTRPNAYLSKVARELAALERDPWKLTERINCWVADNMQYRGGVTSVFTTAAEAITLGEGLCQDYSQVMLAICREAGLPARYVSGHLLGEGGSHAWVEVLLPAERGPQSGEMVAGAFDPTNRCRAGLNYITIAVGRDYSDVSPTSGSFIAPYPGQLIASKKAGLTSVEYV